MKTCGHETKVEGGVRVCTLHEGHVPSWAHNDGVWKDPPHPLAQVLSPEQIGALTPSGERDSPPKKAGK